MREQFQKRYYAQHTGVGAKAKTTEAYMSDAQFLFNQGGWTIALVTPIKRQHAGWKIGLAPLIMLAPYVDFIVTYQRETYP